MAKNLLIHSERPGRARSETLIEVNPESAGWKYVTFSVRRLDEGEVWNGDTGPLETGLVLLRGLFRIDWEDQSQLIGPRKNVFDSYPHTVYFPPQTKFRIEALQECEIANCQAAARRRFPARVVRPEECGFEIRGGGNATRQIVDVLSPEFPADRLIIIEVFTPGGNWSSYPPHKHDEEDPPNEVQLEETYYYRFADPNGYGFQRIYTQNGERDEVFRVTDGDLVLIPDGYHPFVSAYGFNAYYLNVLAGETRALASRDDPRYAAFRHHWPPPDPRVPLVPVPVDHTLA